MDRTELERLAIERYPMPLNPCVWAIRKIEYLREEWVKAKLNISVSSLLQSEL